MQVGIDVKFMHTNFGGRDLSSFGDIATFKNGQFCLDKIGNLETKLKIQKLKKTKLETKLKIQNA